MNDPLNATELLTRATSLLDLSDALAGAIERNYAECARVHDACQSEDSRVIVHAASRALGGLEALLEHAQHLLGAQERELEVLTVELGTRQGLGQGGRGSLMK